MRLLLDACVWGGARRRFEAAGHDCVWAGDWHEDPGDEDILARATEEERTLVTLDKDFGELAVVRGHPHCGILRLVELQAEEQVSVCLHVLARYGEELQVGALITATRNRIRIRPSGAT